MACGQRRGVCVRRGGSGTESSTPNCAEARIRSATGACGLFAPPTKSRVSARSSGADSTALEHAPQRTPLTSNSFVRFFKNCVKLNRQTQEVEHLATRRKQTTATCSNRQKIKFCKTQKLNLPAVLLEGVPVRLLKATCRSFWRACPPASWKAIEAQLEDFSAFLTGLPRVRLGRTKGSVYSSAFLTGSGSQTEFG
jgi:hypothetical protein